MKALANEYLEYIESYLSINTHLCYRKCLKHFINWADGRQNLTEEDLINYQLTLKDWTPNSQYKYISVLKLFFLFLNDTGRIDNNPAVNLFVKLPKNIPTSFTLVKIKSLLKSFPKTKTGVRDRAFVSLCFTACLRRSEAINLTLSDLYLGNREIMVRRTKNDKPRKAVFGKDALEHIYDYLDVREDILDGSCSPWLWINRFGQKLSYCSVDDLNKRIKRDVNGFELFTLHKLRHSMATQIARYTDNGNVGLIAKHLGHTELDTAYRHYIDFNIDDLKKAVDEL